MNRPKIDYNGTVREMTEAEYADYLKAQEELSKLPRPEPSPDERIAALEAQNKELKTALNENTLLLAEIIGGTNK